MECPFTLDKKNTLTFADTTAQYNFFSNLTYYSFDNSSYCYIRDNHSIKVEANIENLKLCNYMMFKNNKVINGTLVNGTKWYYAFIDEMTYLSDNCTEVKFTIDSIQSYLFDMSIKPCFVEREHCSVSEDTIYKNQIDEALGTGEYVCNSISDPDFASYVIIAEFTKYNNAGTWEPIPATPRATAGIPQPTLLEWYAFDANGLTQFFAMLLSVQMANDDSIIKNLFLVSSDSFSHSGSYGTVPTTDYPKSDVLNVTYTSTLDGYSPRNKKLLQSPYRKLCVVNNCGDKTELNFEDFSSTNISFKKYSACNYGCQSILIPLNYKGIAENYNYLMKHGDLQPLSWTTDAYKQWAYQHNIDMTAGAINSLIDLVAQGSISPTTVLTSTLSNITNAVADTMKAKALPNNVHGQSNNIDIITVNLKNKFEFQTMTIKSERARILDSYFDMFGYKTNKVKVPNINNRPKWNYVKTQNSRVIGSIPKNYILDIQNILDEGVTFWHDTSTIFDYSQNNR